MYKWSKGHIPVAGGSPYGMTFGGAGAGAGGVYAPPPYDQLQHHQAIPALSQQLPVSDDEDDERVGGWLRPSTRWSIMIPYHINNNQSWPGTAPLSFLIQLIIPYHVLLNDSWLLHGDDGRQLIVLTK